MSRWMGVALTCAILAACGGSPNAPNQPGVNITGLQVQIQNNSDGSHDYSVTYTVHNGGPADAMLTGIDALLTAKGSQVEAFSVGFGSGRPAPASQFVAPTVTTFTTPAGIPLADSFTLTVHYTAGDGEQTVSRTTPLG
ncbi:MAG TPA: hypothetical protein VL484_14620 [Vicinamibacterales bacterium]|nr:hypothetical protein [Vicinamibacterales bacterium]